MKSSPLSLLLTAFLIVAAHSSSRAGFIDAVSVDIKSADPGLYDYIYTLAISPQSTISAYEFSLTVDTSSNLQSLVTPSGWDVTYNPGDTSITWSTDNFPVTPGTSDVFGFVSALPPVPGTYQSLGFDPDQFQFYPDQGPTLVPGFSSVPEPSSLILSVIGALSVSAIYAWKGRVRGTGGAKGGRQRPPDAKGDVLKYRRSIGEIG